MSSEAAGFWVLLPAVHCRSQAQGNLRTLRQHGAGESCTCYVQVSTLELEGRALSSCTMSPAPSDKVSMAAGKEKSKGPNSPSQSMQKGVNLELRGPELVIGTVYPLMTQLP